MHVFSKTKPDKDSGVGREGAWKLDLGAADTRVFYPGSSSWLKGLVSDDTELQMEAVLSRSSQVEALSAVLQLCNCFFWASG